MRIDEIIVFIRVLESGSFRGAARALAMSTATVSAKISALEQRLGATLIQRTTRQLRATPAGERYLERCKAALAELEAAEAELAPEAEQPTGTLRMTAPAGLSRHTLPQFVANYREAVPSVKIEVIFTNREIDLVAEGIDLALRVGPLPDSSLVVRKLSGGDGGFFASTTYLERHGVPKTSEDLAGHRLIGFGRGTSMQMRKGGKLVDVPFDAPISSNDFHMTRTMIDHDLGIGYLPSLMAEAGPYDPALVRVLPDYTSVKTVLYLAYPQQKFVPARVKSFVAFAVAHADDFKW
jgi:DNA-binding transcriptional LysR family regulator